jgi:multiple antibiotic resistance protein
MNYHQFINHFVTLLVIANPLAALPAVLRVTQDMDLKRKRRTGLLTAFAVGVILISVAWFGMGLLSFLGIKLEAFQVAGSLVLLTLAFSMLNAKESSIKSSESDKGRNEESSGAIVPLAIPIIAGPGAISAVVVSVNQNPGLFNLLLISFSCLLVSLTMALLLYFASNLEKILGASGINVVNRIGGLILASVAIQTFASGILVLLPGLGK